MTPPGTNIGARVRTISATSVDGTEQSFVDQGFQAVSVTGQTHFETPRMVASKANEDRQLSELPGNKSLTLETLMTSNSSNVSPVIDLDRVSTVLTTNRINSPVSNFASDNRVNQTGQDPCASTYVSKMVVLNNPATNLLVEFAAYRRSDADIRVFFKTIAEGSTENSLDRNFELFPGHDNIDQNGKVINFSNNSGLSDDPVPAAVGGEFRDYSFTSRELPPFTKFQIKIDMVGTNQAQPPLIKELREHRTCIMTKHIPVEGKSGFYRDSESTAIINKDKKAYLAYMQRKKSVENKNIELDQMKEDLDNVKGELGEIKGLLSTLVQKLNN